MASNDLYEMQINQANDTNSWVVDPLGQVIDAVTGKPIFSKFMGPAGLAFDAYARSLDGYSGADFAAAFFGFTGGFAVGVGATVIAGPVAGTGAGWISGIAATSYLDKLFKQAETIPTSQSQGFWNHAIKDVQKSSLSKTAKAAIIRDLVTAREIPAYRDDIAAKYALDPSCFPASTPILTPSGTTAISHIQTGDIILAFDPSANFGRGALVEKRVTKLFRNTTTEWIELDFGKIDPATGESF